MPFKQRLHKVVYKATPNTDPTKPAVVTLDLFNKLQHDKTPLLPLDLATDHFNANWPSYADEVCLETYSLDPLESAAYDIHQYWVLRGTLRCACCTGPCHYSKDHNATGSFKDAKRSSTMDPLKNLCHAPGEEYCEALIDLNTLQPLRDEAYQRVPHDAAAFAAEIKEEADAFLLTADDIVSQLGVDGHDLPGVGHLSSPTAGEAVLNGTSTNPEDYYNVASFVVLWQKLLFSAHNKLTRDWPQRGRQYEGKLGPKVTTYTR